MGVCGGGMMSRCSVEVWCGGVRMLVGGVGVMV